MKVFMFLAAFTAVTVAQYGAPQYVPIPYSFSYEAPTEDGGSSSRSESGDGAGRVQGSYTVSNLEGNSRVVEYIADEGGFRVIALRTNERGTANMSPADVNIDSSAPGAINYALGFGAPTGGRTSTRTQTTATRSGGDYVHYVTVPVLDAKPPSTSK